MQFHHAKSSLFTAAAVLCFSVATVFAADNNSRAKLLEPGKPVNRASIPEDWFVTISRGASVRGETISLSWRTMQPGSETSFEAAKNDRIVYVHSGSLQRYDGTSFSGLVEGDIVYDEAGAKSALAAADNSADVMTFQWTNGDSPVTQPLFPTGKPVNRRYLQYLFPAGHETLVSLVQARRGQVAFVRVDPGHSVDESGCPEERILIVLSGGLGIIGDNSSAAMSADDIVRITPGSRFLLTAGAHGCSYILMTGAPRESYTAALMDRIKSFHTLFPRFASPKLLLDGRFGDPLLGFTEGPIWLGGRFCFSDQQVGGFHEVSSGGVHKIINSDIMPCGTTLLPNGNAAVCDITNKRIVEFAPDGSFVRVLTDSYDGKPYSGIPNDVECDAGGGLYFTIMSFAEPPGANVLFYRNPDGVVTRVTEPGDLGIPNGCILSPDCSVLYVNDDKDFYVRAYDVGSDGTLSNCRPFARLILHDTVYGSERTKSFADGMTVDSDGNLYVCASGFIQIFSPGGEYRGGFVFPKPTFHLTFGGEKLSTLYICTMNQLYTLETSVTGVVRNNR